MTPRTPKTGSRKTVLAGIAGITLLFGGLGGWAMTVQIGGAIIASGQIAVQGKPQEIQHLDGGLIEEIRVSDGDLVSQGDILLTLDHTAAALRRDTAMSELTVTLTRAARLRAEEEGAEEVNLTYPDLPIILPDMTVPEADALRLFEARRDSKAGRAARLRETLADQNARIEGMDRQLATIDESLAFAEAELDRQRDLASRQLSRQSDLTGAQMERSRLVERREAMMNERTRLIGERAAAEVDAGLAERSLMEEIVTERSEAETRSRDLALQIVELDAQLARVEIRAPSGGVVHDMQVSTAGSVVAAGATLLQIVPQDRGVLFEVRVDPRHVDQVLPGQEAEMIVAAFDPRSTPRLDGEVAWVSPDTIEDPRTGAQYFRAILEISTEEIARLGDAILVPGMPVEAYLKTNDRTVMAYLVDPLIKSFDHAMRE